MFEDPCSLEDLQCDSEGHLQAVVSLGTPNTHTVHVHQVQQEN